jgi:acid phosphatase
MDGGRSDASIGFPGNIQYVFVVLEENHDWTATKALPYIQHLLQLGAHSEQYYNPMGLHPSEPNYVWIEAGNNYGLTSDDDPSTGNLVKNHAHLAKLLDAAGISWTSYQEDIAADTCPISSVNAYAAKHNPFVFFDDVVGNPPSAMNQHCRDHHKPFTQFLPDLKAGNVAHYNFITPNLDNDMHDGSPARGDTWLSNNIDPIINPLSPNHNPAIYAHAAVIITWDEGTGTSDGPIGLIAVSPYAKVGFTDTVTPAPYYYTHSSLLLSLQEIFGVASTPLGGAATARDLGALFIKFP